MAILSRAVSVTDDPTRLDSITDLADKQPGQSLAFHNLGDATIYVGGADVSVAAGCPVPAGTWSPGLDLHRGDAVYGIVESGACEARVLEVGV